MCKRRGCDCSDRDKLEPDKGYSHSHDMNMRHEYVYYIVCQVKLYLQIDAKIL